MCDSWNNSIINIMNTNGGNLAEWSALRTPNPAVPGSSPALATYWIRSRWSRVQILGHTCK